jgi:hypothetical protein
MIRLGAKVSLEELEARKRKEKELEEQERDRVARGLLQVLSVNSTARCHFLRFLWNRGSVIKFVFAISTEMGAIVCSLYACMY